MADTERFYDTLADSYHLVYRDWREAVVRQGRVLDSLVRSRSTGPSHTLLDCTCGIGTQAIGLALAGYELTGTDLSAQSIERARDEAISFGVTADFAVADVREVASHVSGPFDVAISCDNSLPHLLTNADLEGALANMHHLVRPGGLIVVGIRDYDALRLERPRLTPPNLVEHAGQRSVLFQLWDWADDGETYTLTMFRNTETNGVWTAHHDLVTYRALRRDTLNEAARRAGFHDLQWHMPDTTGTTSP